jgi:hypothetical protein
MLRRLLLVMMTALTAGILPAAGRACTRRVEGDQAGGPRLASPDGRWTAFALEGEPKDPEDLARFFIRSRVSGGRTIRLLKYWHGIEYFWTEDSRYLVVIDEDAGTHFVHVYQPTPKGIFRHEEFDQALQRQLKHKIKAGRQLGKHIYTAPRCEGNSVSMSVWFNDEPILGDGPFLSWKGRARFDLDRARVTTSLAREP